MVLEELGLRSCTAGAAVGRCSVTPHGRSGCGEALLQLDTLPGIALCPAEELCTEPGFQRVKPLWSLGAKYCTGCGVPDFTAQTVGLSVQNLDTFTSSYL